MVLVTSDGKVEKSSLPDSIKELIKQDNLQQEKKQKSLDSDKELLLNSNIPEIQAICRLLGWKK